MVEIIRYEDDVTGIDRTLSYCICTTPRSGSNLLMFTLYELGFGLPSEYLNRNRADVKRYIEHHQNLDLGDMQNFSDGLCQYPLDDEIFVRHLEILQEKRLCNNGIFGTKVFGTDVLHSKTKWETLQRTLDNPKVIYLYRDDIVEQAVSFYIAIHSKTWFQGNDTKTFQPEKIPFDFKSILDLVNLIRGGAIFWNKVLNPMDPNVLKIRYVDLCANFDSTIQEVSQFLGRRITQIPNQPIKKQHNPTKERFLKLFKATLLEYRRRS